ncbi:MAG: DUF3788 family protein [Erysipelothrix sp.]|jgi:hypothetical protein|nr:DUF3788 family protein [Erysipelothrix sp.]
MEEIVFIEKDLIPNDKMLIEALKDSYTRYVKILENLNSMSPNIHTEWKYYGKKIGWLLKHLDSNRNIFFLVVNDGSFKLSFTFGEKIVSSILSSADVRDHTKKLLENAKRYAEGTTIIISVDSDSDVEEVIRLLKYKIIG